MRRVFSRDKKGQLGGGEIEAKPPRLYNDLLLKCLRHVYKDVIKISVHKNTGR